MKKIIWFAFCLIFSIEASAQKNEKLKLPLPAELERIEISKTSQVQWYKPEHLRRLLPKFVASPGTYLTKLGFQYGTFVLKNGKTIKWMASYTDSILLYEGSKHQLYVLPKKRRKPKTKNV
ncbi:MAG TPA: hypothetical protein VF721_04920 [Pyrinomonadaceae bacterium]|jgi:hypothetical protein